MMFLCIRIQLKAKVCILASNRDLMRIEKMEMGRRNKYQDLDNIEDKITMLGSREVLILFLHNTDIKSIFMHLL